MQISYIAGKLVVTPETDREKSQIDKIVEKMGDDNKGKFQLRTKGMELILDVE